MSPENYYGEDGEIIAAVVRHAPDFQGIEFYTKDTDPVQVGKIHYRKDGIIPVHIHNPITKQIVGTAEILFVLSGKVVVQVSGDGWEFQTITLQRGDFIILYPNGFHGLRMVEDTVLFEVKTGPYYGKDKEKSFLDSGGNLGRSRET